MAPTSASRLLGPGPGLDVVQDLDLDQDLKSDLVDWDQEPGRGPGLGLERRGDRWEREGGGAAGEQPGRVGRASETRWGVHQQTHPRHQRAHQQAQAQQRRGAGGRGRALSIRYYRE